MKKYDICKPEKYTGKDGKEKTYWNRVGTMTDFMRDDGTISRIVEIPAIGLKGNVFEQKADDKKTSNTPSDQTEGNGSVDEEEIPF